MPVPWLQWGDSYIRGKRSKLGNVALDLNMADQNEVLIDTTGASQPIKTWHCAQPLTLT
jgi:hypothetical protein